MPGSIAVRLTAHPFLLGIPVEALYARRLADHEPTQVVAGRIEQVAESLARAPAAGAQRLERRLLAEPYQHAGRGIDRRIKRGSRFLRRAGTHHPRNSTRDNLPHSDGL